MIRWMFEVWQCSSSSESEPNVCQPIFSSAQLCKPICLQTLQDLSNRFFFTFQINISKGLKMAFRKLNLTLKAYFVLETMHFNNKLWMWKKRSKNSSHTVCHLNVWVPLPLSWSSNATVNKMWSKCWNKLVRSKTNPFIGLATAEMVIATDGE